MREKEEERVLRLSEIKTRKVLYRQQTWTVRALKTERERDFSIQPREVDYVYVRNQEVSFSKHIKRKENV